MSQHNDWTGMEVAVIGMACRFPGARNVEEYWRNLVGGVESITHLSDEELRLHNEDSPAILDNPNYVKVARKIEDANLFDATLFGYSPREAELIDPQQRLFLECAWEALEHAGQDTERFHGPVGVYAGIKMTTYLWNLYSNPALIASVGELNAQIANDRDYVATRTSYKLGLGGPSMTVQSACSTSLVAVHLACQGLLAGEADMALAGGVSVRTQQISGHVYREGDILSPDGRVRAFDAAAQGTIFGSGLGIVVLRRLEDALADGDRVWAILRGTAVNNDGAAKVGFTAPGADGQERVVRAAHSVAGIDPETISYVEAHGTGTLVGDPIELTALTRAFRAKTDKRGFCAIGSVKTNIGHLASAAGVAGLIKTVLALDHEQLPASLNFERPNPQIDFAASPFYVQTALTPWPRGAAPRRAGVSAFGIGGTNAHAIVEEAPRVAPSGPSRPWQLLPLSARTETALAAQTERLAAHLAEHPEQPLADVAYTLEIGRRELDHRRVLVCRDRADAVAVLSGTGDAGRLLTRATGAAHPQIAFLFSGQGSQHVGMLAGVYRQEAVFRAELDRCAEILRPHLGLDLVRLLDPAPADRAAAEQTLQETRCAQPALFAVEWSLARLFAAWGIEPQAMLGHSIGEYVAACLAGVFSLADALALVAARGRLMQALPPGAMTTVSLPEEEILPLLGPDLAIAAINGPRRLVVSGPFAAIEAFEARLGEQGVAMRRLHTSHAFHSPMMEPALAPFLAEVSRVALAAPERPFLSNVTGTWITAAEATDPEYWVRHLRGSVRFADGLGALFAEPERLLLEVGPGQSLAQLARQHPDRGSRAVIAAARQPKEEQDDEAVLLGALGQLWLAGAEVDWRRFHDGERRLRVTLPSYPFERRNYFVKRAPDFTGAASGQPAVRRHELPDWFYVPYWKPSSPALPQPEAELPAGRWLIFADEAGLGEALAGRLAGSDRTVAVVAAGQGFAAAGPGRYEIAPGRAEDYDRLLEALADDGGLPARIVHCFAVGGDGPAEGGEGGEAVRARLVERSFYSPLFLAQALGRRLLTGQVDVAFVATGLFRAQGDEPLTPEKATLLGPCKVLPQEDRRVACRAIDTFWPDATPGAPSDDAAAGRAELLDRLLAEIGDERRDVGVALRGPRRLVQAWEPIHIERTVEERLPFVERGVYLITGGFGGVGLTLAESLAAGCRARLVLTGRTPLPPREDWDRHLAEHPADDAKSRAIGAVRRLEELGGEVLAAPADVADIAAMRAAVAAAHERFGPIQGVVHAAGLPGGGVVQLKDPKVAAAVLAPKVGGTRVLEDVLAGEPLDFFVLCSSTIAVYGNFGQVDYCAANSFLDAFAEDFAARRGALALSINYGAWRDVGMAVHGLAQAAGATAAAVAAGGVQPGEPALAGPHLHPLVHALVENRDDRKVFASRFTPGELWVIDEHKVAKAPTVPGTGCLEMARAAFNAAFGNGPVELADVFFLSPLRVLDGTVKEARVTLDRGRDGEGSWDFRIASRTPGEAKWQDHAFGKVRAGVADLGRRDREEIAARTARRTDEITGKLLDSPESLVWWGARWQSLRRVHVGDGEALARLELPEELIADLIEMPLHPALLDVATSLVGMLEEGSYLPFAYRRLRIAEALPAKLWSAIRRRDDPSGETVTADVTLFDDLGRVVVDIEGFTLKNVGEAAGRFERQDAVAAPPQPAASANPAGAANPGNSGGATAAAGFEKGREAVLAQSGMSPAEGLEAFRRILGARPGLRVAVSPRDLRALLEQMERARAESLEEAAKGKAVVREAHPRSVQTAFVAPRTDLERRLAEIWQAVLGIDSVGVDDNFYEMGGDSVLSIQVVAAAREAGLELQSSQVFEHQTIATLAVALGDAPAAARSAPAASSERFALAAQTGTSEEQLVRVLAGREAEDAYPLSPLQQGFLFDTLAAAGQAVYIEQMTCTLRGDIDTALLAEAWQRAVDRHPALRTWFPESDELDRPLQIVAARAELPVAVEDLSTLGADERAARLGELRRVDRDTPFELAAAPLMRVHLLRTEERTLEVIWSHHHLLMDGWSSPMVAVEVFATYEALRRGESPSAPPPRPFRDYIAWLAERDLGEAERFFRRYLGGLAGPTALATDRADDGLPRERGDFVRFDAKVEPDLEQRLRDASRREQVTLSVAVATAWALLLGQEGETDDVVYGVSVSGRPPELAGVERMVGCFINALPVRARLGRDLRLGDWLRSFQGEQGELLEHSYAPIVEAQRWAGLAGDRSLFETAFEFWNFPFGRLEGQASFELQLGDYDVATNLPLSLRAIPQAGLELQLTYDRRRFEAATIEHKMRKLTALLASIAERPEATLGELTDELVALDQERVRAAAANLADVAREKLKARRRGVSVT